MYSSNDFIEIINRLNFLKMGKMSPIAFLSGHVSLLVTSDRHEHEAGHHGAPTRARFNRSKPTYTTYILLEHCKNRFVLKINVITCSQRY